MRPPFFNPHWPRSISQVEQDGTQFYAVRVARGGRWDVTRSLREQTGFEEHAGFHARARGRWLHPSRRPLEDKREVLHVIRAASEHAIRGMLAADSWAANGMLGFISIQPWTVLLDGR